MQHTLDELQAILHSKPLTTSTPSMAMEMAESSSMDAYLRLFLQVSNKLHLNICTLHIKKQNLSNLITP